MTHRRLAAFPSRQPLVGAFGRIVTTFMALVMFWLPQSALLTAAQGEPALPAIRAEIERASQTFTLVLSGSGFTAGDMVFIIVHDQWGRNDSQVRWVIASQSVFLPPQDLDPGEGFSVDTGGDVHEAFAIPAIVPEGPSDAQNPALGPVTSTGTSMAGMECSISLLVQAYDRASSTWSDIVEVHPGC